VRFARLIQRRVRVLGGPAVRAAVGGNQMPTIATQRSRHCEGPLVSEL
jgi:hypothetical protein